MEKRSCTEMVSLSGCGDSRTFANASSTYSARMTGAEGVYLLVFWSTPFVEKPWIPISLF